MPHCVAFVFAGLLSASIITQSPSKMGVLLLAHGGSQDWNAQVLAVARTVDATVPTEVAFGMASRASIQAALDRLVSRGATSVVAVPLFVSSWSSVITSTEFLLGLRPEAPPDLKVFAGMDHSTHGPAKTAGAHAGPELADPTSPATFTFPIRMTAALNRHPLVGQVVIDRARSISRSPPTEAVIVVAHGPVPDDDNRRWLEDMAVLTAQLQAATAFASVDFMTVRDDAGPALKEAATQELRGKVEAQVRAGRRVLIVPHVLSFGGIEQGIRRRLEGLDYTMTAQGLIPDPRLAQWVLASAGK